MGGPLRGGGERGTREPIGRRALLAGLFAASMPPLACRPQRPSAPRGILTPLPFDAAWAYDADGTTIRIDPCDCERACLPSYDVPPGHAQHGRLHRRSFVYDDALGVFHALGRGDTDTASSLGNTLVALCMPDDTVGFSFEAASPSFYNAGYVRAGSVAWTAYALARLAGERGEPYLEASTRLARGLWGGVHETPGDARRGLVPAGRGRWGPGHRAFFPDYVADYCVTEHQIDTYFLFRELARVTGRRAWAGRAERLGDSMMKRLWIEPEGRFCVGASARGPNEELGLDAAGAWGTLFLIARGDVDRAQRCLRFTRDRFRTRVRGIDGFAPYAGAVSDYPGRDFSRTLFTEGTASVGVALARLGFDQDARKLAGALRGLARRESGGVPYALPGGPDFPALPAVSPTIWLEFLEGELGGVPSKVFTG